MAVDLGSARRWATALLTEHLRPGMSAIDATMGNGQDTELLARLVGEEGRVWAFDVQQGALTRTRERLDAAGLLRCVQLIWDGHERMAVHVEGPVDAVAFNLGWLPGGDKQITMRVQTTLTALDAALDLLSADGLLTVCVYPGHDEGERERSAVMAWAEGLDAARYQARLTGYLNQVASAPVLIAVRRIR